VKYGGGGVGVGRLRELCFGCISNDPCSFNSRLFSLRYLNAAVLGSLDGGDEECGGRCGRDALIVCSFNWGSGM